MNLNIVPIQFNPDSSEPIYSQLFNHLKQSILDNKLELGDKLPPIRTLAKQLEVNNITVVNAYKQLEHTGYATSKQGSGYYVTYQKADNLSNLPLQTSDSKLNTLINFSSTSPEPSIFPIEPFQKYMNEVIDRDKGYAFSYQEVNGFMPLREVLCELVKNTYDIIATPHCIQLVSGAQQGLDIISKSLLFSGDNVITENPTYYGALDVFKSRGCRITPIEITSTGINLTEFEKKVKICRPKLVYIMPHFQNPTTYSYSKHTLKELLRLADIYDFYILEEDSMWELDYSLRPTLSLKAIDKNNRVIYLKSFSKLLMPGLRMGFLIIPPNLVDSFTKTKQTTDLSSSGLTSRTLELYLKNQDWEIHLSTLKQTYKKRYDYMLSKLNALNEHGISFHKANGGVAFWLRLPDTISAKDLYDRCHSNGLLIFPSPMFYPHMDKLKDKFIRLSFASCSLEEIDKGCEILKECIQHLLLDS